MKQFEQVIGYEFKEKGLLKRALTHSSYANENRLEKDCSNERLEFLGDAVLELATSQYLYEQYPQKLEGELTKLRASIVCETTLAFCANEIHLGKHLLLGKGEELTGGRSRNSVISDAMEAMIGAIFLDGGFANAKEFIEGFILNDLEDKQLFFDSKTILQELVQGNKMEGLVYSILKEEGPDHNKVFEVHVSSGERVLGFGSGRTKKAAEQMAAYKGILKLREEQCI